MTDETTAERRLLCPSCGEKGRRVSPVTMRALLKEEYRDRVTGTARVNCCESKSTNGTGCTPAVRDTGWRFCASPGCDVVYFSHDSGGTFTKAQLRVPVGVKETSGERPLCYCFGHSIASIKEELRTKGRSDAPDDIRAKMKDPGCRCESENPSGSCCLGNVAKGILIAQDELEVGGADLQPPNGLAEPPSNRGEIIAKTGTVVSAIMASACCWLPLALLAMGVSGAGIAATLEAYRPYFTVVTLVFLGAAFYYTYRPKRAAAGAGRACCGPEATEVGGCCPPASKGRFSMLALNKVMLWVVTAMAVAFLLFPNYVGALLGGEGKAVTDNMDQAVVRIEGMTCEGCGTIVAKAIRSVPGVLAVEVNYSEARAVVGTEIGYPIPEDKIQSVLQQAGYNAEFVDSN